MKVYKAYVETGIEEQGELLPSQIPQLLKEAAYSLNNNDYSLGFRRSDEDFIEVSYVGKSQYLLWSDSICKIGSFWQRLFKPRHIQPILQGEGEALKAIDIYINNPREHFETTYT